MNVMVNIVQQNIGKIDEVCREMNVKSLYLIGSAARDKDFTQDSDLDFVYTFIKNDNGIPVSGHDYFDLLFRLEEITGKKVDLVAEEKIKNRYFLNRIMKERIKIYES